MSLISLMGDTRRKYPDYDMKINAHFYPFRKSKMRI